jgi:hypothetical protein
MRLRRPLKAVTSHSTPYSKDEGGRDGACGGSGSRFWLGGGGENETEGKFVSAGCRNQQAGGPRYPEGLIRALFRCAAFS